MAAFYHLDLIMALVFVSVTRTICVEYMDLEFMGINCPNGISCLEIDNTNFSRRNCECDRDCVIYQDCCVDARMRGIARNRMPSPFTCVPFGNEPNMGAYVIQTCSRNYIGPADMQRKCRNKNDVSDPFMAAPVTDTVSGTSYRNRYCAECNNVDSIGLQNWMLQMDCDFTSNINVSNDFIWNNIQYRPNLNKWGIDVNNRFFICYLNFDIPEYLQGKVRFCRSNVISTCPRTWTRMLVKRECESYTAITYVTSSDNVYRNPHCAICHGNNVDDMRCDRGISSRKKKPFSFALLLDINQSDGDVVGLSKPKDKVCEPNQKYDPFAKKCRNLVCALPGFKLVKGKCQKPK